MKVIFLGLLMLASGILHAAEHPVMNLPNSLSQRNWNGGFFGDGSCVVASMIDLLRWQGKHAAAARLRERYAGGQNYNGWTETLDREGIKYAGTYRENNVDFLERAIATRRGCMVGVGPYKNKSGELLYVPAHMVCLIDMTPTKVCILDNNEPYKHKWLDREKFLRGWERAGSWALTPVYTPTSPRIP